MLFVADTTDHCPTRAAWARLRDGWHVWIRRRDFAGFCTRRRVVVLCFGVSLRVADFGFDLCVAGLCVAGLRVAGDLSLLVGERFQHRVANLALRLVGEGSAAAPFAAL